MKIYLSIILFFISLLFIYSSAAISDILIQKKPVSDAVEEEISMMIWFDEERIIFSNCPIDFPTRTACRVTIKKGLDHVLSVAHEDLQKYLIWTQYSLEGERNALLEQHSEIQTRKMEIQKLSEKIPVLHQTLEREQYQLRDKFEDLEKKSAIKNALALQLEAILKRLANDPHNDLLKQQMDRISNSLTEINANLENLRNEATSLEEKVVTIETKINETQQTISKIEDELSELRKTLVVDSRLIRLYQRRKKVLQDAQTKYEYVISLIKDENIPYSIKDLDAPSRELVEIISRGQPSWYF